MTTRRKPISIPEDEILVSFVLAGGPGGQNVNKVATAAQLRFDAAHSRCVTAQMLARLKVLAGRRMTKTGVIVITANRYRSQSQNRIDALARLTALLEASTHKPKPRVPTKPSLAAKQRRLQEKRRKGDKKKERLLVDWSRYENIPAFVANRPNAYFIFLKLEALSIQ